jgi:hypothetical protein
MSSKACATKENGLSPAKHTLECTSESSVQTTKTTSATSNNVSFLSMFQNSNSRTKIQRQTITTQQTADESLLNATSKDRSPDKQKNKEISNKLYNSTQPTDTNKMVVSFQSGNSGGNHSVSNNSISFRANNSTPNFVSSGNSTRPVNKPAAGKVLKNGSSGTSSTKDGDINKKKAIKGLDHTTINGSTLTTKGTKHHSSHQDNHRSSHSVPNSRNNSGGNNTKGDKKEMLDMEHSSVSTDSSTHSSNSTASKLSKIGRRLRDSCRNLRGKHSSGGSSNHDPQDYTSIQPPNV